MTAIFMVLSGFTLLCRMLEMTNVEELRKKRWWNYRMLGQDWNEAYTYIALTVTALLVCACQTWYFTVLRTNLRHEFVAYHDRKRLEF